MAAALPAQLALASGSAPASPRTRSGSEDGERDAKRPKIYVCAHPGCGKSFGRRDYLERHAANHLRDRPYLCPTCGKSYARADVLKRHVLNHPRPRPPSRPGLPESPFSAGAHAQSAGPEGYLPAPLGYLPDPAPQALPYPDAPVPTSLTALPNYAYSQPPSQPSSRFASPRPEHADWADTSTICAPGSAPDPAAASASASALAGTICEPRADGLPGPPEINFELSDAAASELYTWFLTTDLSNLLQPTGNVDGAMPGVGASGAAVGAGWMEPPPVFEDVEGDALDAPGRVVTSAMAKRIHDETQALLGYSLPLRAFTTKDLNNYFNLYYSRFDPLFPIVHRLTLRARNPSTPLLLAMISIGSAFAPDTTAFNVLLDVHKKLRRHMMDIVEEQPRPETHVLQTLALVGYFGRMYGSAHDYDVNQIYHSSLMTIARFIGLFRNSASHWTHAQLVGPAAWCTWAEAEERVRLAWMMFATDTFNATFLRQPLTIQSSQLDVPLPCHDSAWNAPTADAWIGDRGPDEPFLYQAVLRQLLDDTTLPVSMSSFGLWAILQGLMALAVALCAQRPDGFTLARRTQITQWKGVVYRSIAHWHQRALAQLETAADPTTLAQLRAGVPICNICILHLLSDLDAIRMFAGAPRLGGREVLLDERVNARTQLEGWAVTPEARQTCWFALESLQQVFRWMGDADARQLAPSTQWCVVITVWAYATLVEERYVDVKLLGRVTPSTRCRVEPVLARRAALAYCERVLACEDPVNLPATQDIGQCLAVVACSAHVCSVGERGINADPTRVLYGLLKVIESRKKNAFVTC
ncbi:hypothetical protein Q5752_000151 [Cryptotrichosporon argae]